MSISPPGLWHTFFSRLVGEKGQAVELKGMDFINRSNDVFMTLFIGK
jgi:hypothetical protein